MAKKDFTASTEEVLDVFFSAPAEVKKEEPKQETTKPNTETKKVETTKKEVEQETKKTTKKATVSNVKEKTEKKPEEEKKEETISTPEVKAENIETKKTTSKSYNKDCRYNFYLDIDLADFVTNYLWLTRHRSYSQYFNHLIKQDLLKRLGLPEDTTNEELLKKWEEYKKENNL